MKKIYLLLCGMMFFSAQSQTIYSGNGKTGFGGTVGNGTLTLTKSADLLTITFDRGTDKFNNAIVIYIDSKPGGITSTAELNDSRDGLRMAISGVNKNNRTILTFPSGFKPDYALAFMPSDGVGYGGLWDLTANTGGDEGGAFGPDYLRHIKSANLLPLGVNEAATYTLQINISDLDLPDGSETFNFLANYISPTAWRSNEFFGDNGPINNPGDNTPYTVTTYLNFNWIVVPVTLSSFSAYTSNNNVNLQWTTAQESNIDRYEILRSADGKQFDKIGSVNANNLATVQQYSFTDAQPLPGDNFYKLAIVSKDNHVEYSKIVSVKSNSVQSFKAYFTSSNRILKLELPSTSSSEWTLEINNTSGQKIFRTVFNSNGSPTQSVDLNKQLPAGVYAISLINNGEKISKMIMVK